MRIVIITAGKGGVGKSRITVNLARRMAWKAKVGILDLDFDGPDVLAFLGEEGAKVGPIGPDHRLVPLTIGGMRILSTSALVSRSDIGAAWSGEHKSRAVKDFLTGAEWGDTEMMLIDCPAGISDQMMTLTDSYDVKGAIVVTTPDVVAQLDASKVIHLFQRRQVPIIGVLENKAYRRCPHCNTVDRMFGTSNVQDNLALRYRIPFLGQVPWSNDGNGVNIDSETLDQLSLQLLREDER